MRKFILLLAVACSFGLCLNADVYIKSESTAGSNVLGKMATKSVTETWLGDQISASISQESTIIINLVNQTALIANHTNKTYIQSLLPLKHQKLMPTEMAKMLTGMVEDMKIIIRPTGRTKNILNLPARGYDVFMTISGMNIRMVIWASTQVPFDWKQYSDIYLQMTKAKLKLADKYISEFKKIEGFQLGIDMNIMDLTISTTVKEINPSRIAPEGIYQVPAGYTKKDSISMSKGIK